MYKSIIFLTVLFSFNSCTNYSPQEEKSNKLPTSIGMVIYSNDTETVWNALRFANFSKSQGDSVSIFLLGKGVELEALAKSDANVKEQTDKFLNSGGTILGCGTCLQSRNNNDPLVCKFSSLKDLYEIVRKNKIILTF